MIYDEMSINGTPELMAVNEILASIGEPPVVTLDGEANADVANARRILSTINRRIQSKGWTWNIEEAATLTPEVSSGLIPFLPEYLSIMVTGGQSPYINRGGFLLDRTTGQDTFAGPVVVKMIRLRDYDEMPEVYRSWIVTKAARQFNNRFFGAPEIEAVLAEEEAEAYRAVNEYELDYGNYNMLDGDAWTGGQLSR